MVAGLAEEQADGGVVIGCLDLGDRSEWVRLCILTFPVVFTGSQLQLGEQFLDGELVMRGHGFQHTAQQGAGFQRALIWTVT